MWNASHMCWNLLKYSCGYSFCFPSSGNNMHCLEICRLKSEAVLPAFCKGLQSLGEIILAMERRVPSKVRREKRDAQKNEKGSQVDRPGAAPKKGEIPCGSHIVNPVASGVAQTPCPWPDMEVPIDAIEPERSRQSGMMGGWSNSPQDGPATEDCKWLSTALPPQKSPRTWHHPGCVWEGNAKSDGISDLDFSWL